MMNMMSSFLEGPKIKRTLGARPEWRSYGNKAQIPRRLSRLLARRTARLPWTPGERDGAASIRGNQLNFGGPPGGSHFARPGIL